MDQGAARPHRGDRFEHYNAFLVVTADKALAQAKAAEAEIAKGQWRGPMHGVPYAAKDIFDIEGMATTCHSKIRKDHRATSDAFVVKKLRDAGAVLLGKVALHEFATGGPAFDLPWPPARNPWNRDLHPGGSSSGSGAALAAGMAPAALGTDTGGSVRNPATCCGIVGMKPTYGAVSLSGVFPLTYSLDHVGPMTRTVEDNAILFHAIAGHDPGRSDHARRARRRDCLKDLKRGLKGLRIGVIEHFYKEDAEADPDQVRGIEQAVDVLHKLGASVKTIRLSPLPLWTDCNRTIHQAEAYAIHERDVQERPEDFAALTRNRLLPGAFVSAAKYIRAQQLRARAVPRVRRGDARSRRGGDAVEPAAAVPDRRSGGDRADLRPAVPARVQRHRHAGDLGADRLHRRRRAARHADRRPRLRRADGLSRSRRPIARRPARASTPTSVRREGSPKSAPSWPTRSVRPYHAVPSVTPRQRAR